MTRTNTFKIETLLRENIQKLAPYASARDEYKGTEGVFLDANENPLTGPYNRYPDPLQWKLKERIGTIKKIHVENIFLGNGSDEPIDLLFRAFCSPGKDNIITMPPTYGMYEVCANINDVAIKEVPLTEDFEIETEKVLNAVDKNTKLIFVCSPNNPTGNILKTESIINLLENFNGLVVVDEAYIDFAPDKTFLPQLAKYPNLLVLQTFSKAWGMAGLRLGMAFSSKETIAILNKIKYPYNISGATQLLVLEGLKNLLMKEQMVAEILTERERLKEELLLLPSVLKIYPSDANFILVKTVAGTEIYNFLIDHKIITRNRSKVILCNNCIRITVGTRDENDQLLAVLKTYKA